MNISDIELILTPLDKNYVKTTECSSGSAYYRCGSLRIRVSNHFKKILSEASCCDVSLITAPGLDGFIVLPDRSLHPMVVTDFEILKDFLTYEKFRRDTFYPRPSASEGQNDSAEPAEAILEPREETFESADPSKPWDCDWPLGEESKNRIDSAFESARKKYKDIENVAEYLKAVLRQPTGPTYAGTLMSCAFREAGLKYVKNMYKSYKTFTGSYKELVYSLGEPEKYQQLLYNP